MKLVEATALLGLLVASTGAHAAEDPVFHEVYASLGQGPEECSIEGCDPVIYAQIGYSHLLPRRPGNANSRDADGRVPPIAVTTVRVWLRGIRKSLLSEGPCASVI